MREIWKDILGYEGLYQVSNKGRVRSLDKKRVSKDGTVRLYKGKILKTTANYNGYERVGLDDGEQTIYSVYRIEWEAFYGPIPPGMQVNHINEDKTDNRLENLNLMTSKENCNWGTRNAKISKARTNNPKVSKPVLQFTKDGEFVAEYPSVGGAERQTGISHISPCCLNKKGYNSAGGFKWSYKSSSSDSDSSCE